MNNLRIATRSSQLALAQTNQVADQLRQIHPGLSVEIIAMATRGDRTGGSLVDLGGKGLFTIDLEEALRDGRVDLAVHSAKDMPLVLPGDMTIASCPLRADARDALVSSQGWNLSELPREARVGTSSLRRAAQVLHVRPDVKICALRGNIQTRINKALSGELDAVVLAMAGMKRAGLAESLTDHISPLDPADFIPASGQGILAIETLTLATSVRHLLAPLNDDDSHKTLMAERSLVRALSADCSSPVGVHIFRDEHGWSGRAMAASRDAGSDMISAASYGLASAAAVADELVRELTEKGVRTLLGLTE